VCDPLSVLGKRAEPDGLATRFDVRGILDRPWFAVVATRSHGLLEESETLLLERDVGIGMLNESPRRIRHVATDQRRPYPRTIAWEDGEQARCAVAVMRRSSRSRLRGTASGTR